MTGVTWRQARRVYKEAAARRTDRRQEAVRMNQVPLSEPGRVTNTAEISVSRRLALGAFLLE